MKYEIILEEGEYALILRGNELKEYAVVRGLDKKMGTWDGTVWYRGFEFRGAKISGCTQPEVLSCALENFRSLTEKKYISRSRLEELATLLKDALLEENEEGAAIEYFDEVCEMTEIEKNFFEIKTVEEE